MAQQNTLPDPNFRRADDGDDASGSYGPGFASVKLGSNQKIMTDRTNSGRITQRSHAYHKFTIDITYNPMTKAEFLPVYAFLMERRTTMAPFYVQLPQYRGQTTATGINTDNSGNTSQPSGNTVVSLANNDANDVNIGDLFTINDSNHTDHEKAYMVTKITQTGSYDTITITPPLAKEVSDGASLTFVNPKIKVIQVGDVQQSSLNSNNLYSFSLKLEEVQQ